MIAPLLVEIIACGTLYLSESDMAEELHVMALSMMPQVRTFSLGPAF